MERRTGERMSEPNRVDLAVVVWTWRCMGGRLGSRRTSSHVHHAPSRSDESVLQRLAESVERPPAQHPRSAWHDRSSPERRAGGTSEGLTSAGSKVCTTAAPPRRSRRVGRGGGAEFPRRNQHGWNRDGVAFRGRHRADRLHRSVGLGHEAGAGARAGGRVLEPCVAARGRSGL